MAKAHIEIKLVTKTIGVEKRSYLLELSEAEAQTLADLLGYVGGPKVSRRKHLEQIRWALLQAGVQDLLNDELPHDINGGINFNSEE
jgi:hypothetical protein